MLSNPYMDLAPFDSPSCHGDNLHSILVFFEVQDDNEKGQQQHVNPQEAAVRTH